MEKEDVKNVYIAFRFIEVICIGVFIFGFLWEGTELLKLTLPEFMMLYGGVGAVLSEGIARILHRYLKKNEIMKEK